MKWLLGLMIAIRLFGLYELIRDHQSKSKQDLSHVSFFQVLLRHARGVNELSYIFQKSLGEVRPYHQKILQEALLHLQKGNPLLSNVAALQEKSNSAFMKRVLLHMSMVMKHGGSFSLLFERLEEEAYVYEQMITSRHQEIKKDWLLLFVFLWTFAIFGFFSLRHLPQSKLVLYLLYGLLLLEGVNTLLLTSRRTY